MKVQKLPAARRGQMQNPSFEGYQLFSNGTPGTGRPDGFGAVFVFNDDTLHPGSYLGMHPHANTEIVTLVVAGRESHEDNLGYRQELAAGDVQLISAGAGVDHAGGNVSAQEAARHLQIWLAPEATNTPPTVQRKYPGPAAPGQWQALISPDGAHDTLPIKQQAWFYDGTFAPGPARYALHDPCHGVLLYVLSGKVSLAGHPFTASDTAFISGTAAVELAVEEAASLVLIESVL